VILPRLPDKLVSNPDCEEDMNIGVGARLALELVFFWADSKSFLAIKLGKMLTEIVSFRSR
jgi:hypothetical protein